MNCAVRVTSSEAHFKSFALQSSLQPQSAVAALPLPPPSPACAGTVFSSRIRNLRFTPCSQVYR